MAVSSSRSGTRITTSAASMHIYHVASGTPDCDDPTPGAHPEGHGGEDRDQACDEAHEETLAEDPDRLCGDSHYGRVKAMEWAEDNDTDYIFGLAGNAALDAVVAEAADNLRFHHAMSSKAKLRSHLAQ